MAGRGGCCTPLLHCFHRWGHLHLWLLLASHTSLWKRVGGHIDFDLICFLVRLKSKLFEVHQFSERSHLTLMNDESQLRKPQLILNKVPASVQCGGVWRRCVEMLFNFPVVCFDLHICGHYPKKNK